MATPSAELKDALEAARAGDWDAAHAVAQRHQGEKTADWLHAVLHKIEGDASNARYWYGRCGQSYEAYADATAELDAIQQALSG